MSRSRVWFLVLTTVFLVSLILVVTQPISASSSNQQGSPTPTLEPESAFYRTVQMPMVRVIKKVRARSEPDTAHGSASVIRTARVGEEFSIRSDIEPVEAQGYTWLPVVVDDQNAWMAEQGFLERFSVKGNIPVSQEEIDLAYAAGLPNGAVDTLAENGRLYAVDTDGAGIAFWDWGNGAGQGQWKAILTAIVNGHTVTFSTDISGLTLKNLDGNSFARFLQDMTISLGAGIDIVISSIEPQNAVLVMAHDDVPFCILDAAEEAGNGVRLFNIYFAPTFFENFNEFDVSGSLLIEKYIQTLTLYNMYLVYHNADPGIFTYHRFNAEILKDVTPNYLNIEY